MKTYRVWRKIAFLIILFSLFSGVLTACGAGTQVMETVSAEETSAEKVTLEETAAETTVAETTTAETSSEETTPLPAKELVEGVSFNGLDEEKAIRDYEAFWEIVEDSYPMLGLLKRKGTDPEAVKAKYRAMLPVGVLGDEYRSFYADVISELSGGDTVGHLTALYPGYNLLDSDYQYYAFAVEKWPNDPWIEMMGHLFDDPKVIGFYGLEVKPRESEDEPPRIKLENNVGFGYYPESDYAYLAVDSFLNEDPKDTEMIREFFIEAEKEGIGHVIIDVRGNLGGYNDYWMRNIVAPNASEVYEIQNIGLYNETPYNAHYLNYYAASTYEQDIAELKKEGDLPDIMIRWNRRERELPELPELAEGDVEDLELAFQETLRIAPTEEQPLFSGKFWVLVDERSYSASEYFVSFAKRTGFATSVGKESGGDGSCVVTIYNQLPESGLVIRYNVLYGLNYDGSCSEDQATSPDHVIEDWEDALDVTVGLIAEENQK